MFRAAGFVVDCYIKSGEPTFTVKSALREARLPGLIPHDFRRTAIRNFERAGISRSVAMKMVGHRTESVYRRHAIADETMLREAGTKLTALHQAERGKRSHSRAIILLEKD